MDRKRLLLLVADGVALIGVVVFSVLAALPHSKTLYVVGQIVCAVLILASALLLRRMGNSESRPGGDSPP